MGLYDHTLSKSNLFYFISQIKLIGKSFNLFNLTYLVYEMLSTQACYQRSQT
jgi:hypothetical protein